MAADRREDWTKHFATEAQHARDERGLTVRALAAESGVPVMVAHRAVTTGNILLSSALRIAVALDMRLGDFHPEINPEPPQ